MSIGFIFIAAVGGYLSGSVPYGILLTGLAGKGDIRDIGSGNIGATNVLRTGSKLLAIATLLLDFLKGMVPVLIFSSWGFWLGVVAGICAFLGHIFPIWLKFKGGKGVATYLCVITGLSWPGALLFCAAWLVIALAFRFSSLAGIVAPIIVAVSALFIGNADLLWPFLLMAVIIIYTHRENIKRLLKGRESKIKLGK